MSGKNLLFAPAAPNRIRRLLVLLLLTTVLLWASTSTRGGEPDDAGGGTTDTVGADQPTDTALSVPGDQETREYLEYSDDRLRREREALETLRGELMDSVTRMERLSAQIDKKYEDQKTFEAAKVDELAAIYGMMKAPQIAERLFELAPNLRYEVLARLKQKLISKVLVELSPEKAALVSRKLLEVRGVSN